MYFDLQFMASTQVNASTAELKLPAGTNNIKFARLYWGGKYNSNGAFIDSELMSVKLRKDGATYKQIAAIARPDKWLIKADATHNAAYAYQAYADIICIIL